MEDGVGNSTKVNKLEWDNSELESRIWNTEDKLWMIEMEKEMIKKEQE